jgi:hypothetical protein
MGLYGVVCNVKYNLDFNQCMVTVTVTEDVNGSAWTRQRGLDFGSVTVSQNCAHT